MEDAVNIKQKYEGREMITYKETNVTREEKNRYENLGESQFFDRKSVNISPAKLSEALSAFANADGGEVLVGMEDDCRWVLFENQEAANPIIEVAAELLFPEYFDIEFLNLEGLQGKAVLFTIQRHPSVIRSTKGNVHLRRNASSKKLKESEITKLSSNKTGYSYEMSATQLEIGDVLNTEHMIDFMVNGNALSEPLDFIRRNKLEKSGYSTIVATLLFSENPQATLPSAAIKIYRYKTDGSASRDHLDGIPQTIEGNIIDMIVSAKQKITDIVSRIPAMKESGLERVSYPTEAIHEIITNALLHRDYRIQDYVHIKIFDNRIEIESPGKLHGHVTESNILDERSARNPTLQRIVNKFPDPPNMDIGEGLNTAFDSMTKMNLKSPVINELDDRVKVTIAHDPLASPQLAIMDFVRENGSINNEKARAVTKIPQERTVRRLFEELVSSGELVREGRSRGTFYRLPDD